MRKVIVNSTPLIVLCGYWLEKQEGLRGSLPLFVSEWKMR